MTNPPFVLDPRLQDDTAWLTDWPLCSVLLMNDRRYPWLILVPRRHGMVEAFDLGGKDQMRLWHEVSHAGELLKRATGCRKINIGALGNVVRQLHIHVIARSPTDSAGDAPVWGRGKTERYEPEDLPGKIDHFRSILSSPS